MSIKVQLYPDPEVCMELSICGRVAYLKGDWTLNRITQKNIHALADSLVQLASSSHNNQEIDCKQITRFDLSGLQFLYTWLQCFRLRGIEPVLINLPDKLQKVAFCLEFQNCH